MKFENIQPGMVLLDIRRRRMGNTTMREWAYWGVEIVSVDAETRTAMVRWNSNPPRRWGARDLEKLKTKKTKALLEQEARRRAGRL